MKRLLLISAVILLTGCGGRQGTVLKTWTSLGDYSIDFSADDDEFNMQVTPSVRMETVNDVFNRHLELVLRYPEADERLDVGIISIFTSDEPQVELPPITVKVDYILTDEVISSDEIDEDAFSWQAAGTFRIRPGQSRRLRIKNAAGHRMAVTRSQVFSEDTDEMLTRYLHGFELE